MFARSSTSHPGSTQATSGCILKGSKNIAEACCSFLFKGKRLLKYQRFVFKEIKITHKSIDLFLSLIRIRANIFIAHTFASPILSL